MMANVDRNTLTTTQQRQLEKLFVEYKAWLLADSDRSNALTSLANFYLMQGDTSAAQQYFEKALQRDENSISALLNYADYYRNLNNDNEAETLLRKAMAIYPDSADVHYALGLLLVRTKHYPAAMIELKQAKTLAPLNSQYIYVYAIGLYSTGSTQEAIAALAQARAQFPANPQISSALLAYCAEQHNTFPACQK